ncbi:hypothetical protein BD289DRAFT_476371 [Coniella lustricola]|uniref:Uncharacterized protein n=1 Tax=Coniella lustricola TaxID=2025994 RepID=A0A2T2ZZ02_9PEZI|nr:hypothetical protein BD289DRAFT_476371 [Coniella lustricola]
MNDTGDKPPTNADLWDEAAIEEALKDLRDLHHRVRQMRLTVPKMSERVCASRTTETGEIREAIGNARKEIDDLKHNMTKPESKKIFEHAKQSRQDDSKDIKPWDPKDETKLV